MTLEESIEQVEKIYKENRSGWLYALKRGETKYAERCKKSMDEFRQLAEWLKELAERRKLPEIITCGECVNFVERDFCKVAGHNVHRKSNCMKVFGAERRTDGRETSD